MVRIAERKQIWNMCSFLRKNIKIKGADSTDIASNKHDTAWSRLLEAIVNRGAKCEDYCF